MNHIINIGGKHVILRYMEDETDVNVDEITKIDYSNIFGEVVTLPALLNKTGMLRAEAEKIFNSLKLECEIHSAGLKRAWRREAATQSGKGKFSSTDEMGNIIVVKLSESALDEAVTLDKKYQKLKNDLFKAQRDLGFIDSLHWAVSSKDKKLNNLLKPVSPEEFVNELIDGAINGFIIKKVK